MLLLLELSLIGVIGVEKHLLIHMSFRILKLCLSNNYLLSIHNLSTGASWVHSLLQRGLWDVAGGDSLANIGNLVSNWSSYHHNLWINSRILLLMLWIPRDKVGRRSNCRGRFCTVSLLLLYLRVLFCLITYQIVSSIKERTIAHASVLFYVSRSS